MYNKRQQAILAYLAKHEEASNADLMEAAGSCSVMTQWRDLKELEEDGKIFRYRGGARVHQPDGRPGRPEGESPRHGCRSLLRDPAGEEAEDPY